MQGAMAAWRGGRGGPAEDTQVLCSEGGHRGKKRLPEQGAGPEQEQHKVLQLDTGQQPGHCSLTPASAGGAALEAQVGLGRAGMAERRLGGRGQGLIHMLSAARLGPGVLPLQT